MCETQPGQRPELPDHVDGDVYAYPHNETSTGVMVPVHRPDRSEALVVVDGTSGASGMRVDPSAFDVYYFAPQKCFASDGGLWLALCSRAAIDRIEQLRVGDRWMPPTLDLSIAVENSRLDQTYNTPALATIFLLDHTLQWMLANGGLEFSAGRCDAAAGIVYGWAEQHAYATPFVADAVARSHVTATIDFDESVDAPPLPPRCAPTASSTSNRTESSAVTSCVSRCSRRSIPKTSSGSHARSTSSSTGSTRHDLNGVHRLADIH